MDRLEPLDAARVLIERDYPTAAAAFLAGSAATARRTTTSDLDIVVITDDEHAPFRSTEMELGWIVEWFVHTPESLERYWGRGVERRQPTLLRMCAESTILIDIGGMAQEIQARARTLLAAGPSPYAAEAIEDLRYHLTALADDLETASDAEASFVAAEMLREMTSLVLAIRGQWTGTGKWAGRQLLAADPAWHARILAAYRTAEMDRAPLIDVAHVLLEEAGGSLQAGYRRGGAGR